MDLGLKLIQQILDQGPNTLSTLETVWIIIFTAVEAFDTEILRLKGILVVHLVSCFLKSVQEILDQKPNTPSQSWNSLNAHELGEFLLYFREGPTQTQTLERGALRSRMIFLSRVIQIVLSCC